MAKSPTKWHKGWWWGLECYALGGLEWMYYKAMPTRALLVCPRPSHASGACYREPLDRSIWTHYCMLESFWSSALKIVDKTCRYLSGTRVNHYSPMDFWLSGRWDLLIPFKFKSQLLSIVAWGLLVKYPRTFGRACLYLPGSGVNHYQYSSRGFWLSALRASH